MLAARTYIADRDMAKAEDALQRVIQAEPTNLRAYSALGQLYFAQTSWTTRVRGSKRSHGGSREPSAPTHLSR